MSKVMSTLNSLDSESTQPVVSSGTNTGDVTLGTANGLSLAGQVLSLQAATGSVPGALTAADWTTFNGKQSSLGYTPMKTDYSNAGSPPTWNQNTTGSAAKLTTARTINGVSFDGSANIQTATANTSDYSAGTFTGTITVAGGSVTQTYSTMAYVKVGKLVIVTGEITLSGVSSPSGAVSVTGLPYTNSSLSGRSSIAGFYVRAYGLTGVATGHVNGYISAGSTTINLQFFEAGVQNDLGAKLTANAVFDFSFSYISQ